jgi:3-methylcrotonyl-CoA carboxylase alpha subunit
MTSVSVEPPVDALAAAAASVLAERAHSARAAAQIGTDAHSPWALATAWRLNGAGYQDFVLRHGGTDYPVRGHPKADGSLDLEIGSRRLHVSRQVDTLLLDGARHRVPVARNGDELFVLVDGTTWPLELIDPLLPPKTEGAGGDRLTAPMPGRIVSVNTEPGAQVKRGDVLLVLEAMKVQMRLSAPRDGIVASVRAQPGELVDDGAELVSFEPAA